MSKSESPFEAPVEKEVSASATPQLNLEEAHEEANMMRAELGIDKEGRIPQTMSLESRKPRSEDYDRALEAIEEIKKLAEEEPDSVKMLFKVGRALRGAGQLVGHVLDSIAIAAPRPIGGGANARDVRMYRESLDEGLVDAEKRLRDLKKAAENFGKREK